MKESYPINKEHIDALKEELAIGASRGKYNSGHEMYGIIKEELEEFFETVRIDDPDEKEALQIAATAFRAYIQLKESKENWIDEGYKYWKENPKNGAILYVRGISPKNNLGLLVNDKHLRHRKSKHYVVAIGYIPGHGGDCIFCRHKDNPDVVSAYFLCELIKADDVHERMDHEPIWI